MKKNIPKSDRVLRSVEKNIQSNLVNCPSDFPSQNNNMIRTPPASVSNPRTTDPDGTMVIPTRNNTPQSPHASIADFRAIDPNPNSNFTRTPANYPNNLNQPISSPDRDNADIEEEIAFLRQRLHALTSRVEHSSAQNLAQQPRSTSRVNSRESLFSDHETRNLNNRNPPPPVRSEQNRQNKVSNHHPSRHSETESSTSEYESLSTHYKRHSPPRNQSRYRNNDKFCRIEKWPIRFNGSNVKTFLKRLDRYQHSYSYDDELVLKFFYYLVEGKAEKWYWQYLDEFRRPTLSHLKSQMLKRFKTDETDLSIISRMHELKQGKNSFEDFYNDMLDMNYELDRPLSDPEIIEILRNNINDEVLQRIFTLETKDKTVFFHKANRAYKDIVKIRQKRKELYFKSQRNVSEIDFDDLSSLEVEEISSKLKSWKDKRSSAKCFNCNRNDHFLKDCPDDITRFFCFKCGKEDVSTPKCPKCNPKNLN